MPKRKNRFGDLGDSDYDSDYCFSDDDDFAPKAKKKDKPKKDKKKKKSPEKSKKGSDGSTKKAKATGYNADDSIIVLDDDSGPSDVYSVKRTSSDDLKLTVTLEKLSPNTIKTLIEKEKTIDGTEKKEVDGARPEGEQPRSEDRDVLVPSDKKALTENLTEENNIQVKNAENGLKEKEAVSTIKSNKKKAIDNETITDDCKKETRSDEKNKCPPENIDEEEISKARKFRETKARKNHVKFNPLQYVEPVKTPPIGLKFGLSRNSRPKKSLHPLLSRTSL